MSHHFYCFSHLNHIIFFHPDYCIADFCFQPGPLRFFLSTVARLVLCFCFFNFCLFFLVTVISASFSQFPARRPLLAVHSFSGLIGHSSSSLHPSHPGLLFVAQTHQTCSPIQYLSLANSSAWNAIPADIQMIHCCTSFELCVKCLLPTKAFLKHPI